MTQSPDTIRHSGHARATGFSLVEMMVISGIIAILIAALTLTSFRIMGATAEKQTRVLLASLKGVAEEYESQVGTAINITGNSPIDWSTNKSRTWPPNATGTTTPPIHTIDRFLWAALQYPTARKMVFAISKNHFPDPNNQAVSFMFITDGWGTRLKYMPSNNNADPTLPNYPFSFFASAGDDRAWGDESAAPNSTLKLETEDNLYSFRLD